MPTVTIDVTAEDIRSGVPHKCFDCPVALAMLQATGSHYHVGGSCARKWNDGNSKPVRLPREAVLFIEDLDLGRPVAPFSFTIDLPE